jgi:coproporphyrinogen III oxidase
MLNGNSFLHEGKNCFYTEKKGEYVFIRVFARSAWDSMQHAGRCDRIWRSLPPHRQLKGYREPMGALDAGKVVQSEWIGFVRIEKATDSNRGVLGGHR